MALRAIAAHWFELLVPRASLARAVETMAATGTVELDAAAAEAEPLNLSGLQAAMQDYQRLAQLYAEYWPAPAYRAHAGDVLLETSLQAALERLQAWERDAAPRLRRIEALRRDLHELGRLEGFLEVARDEGSQLDLGRLAHAAAPLASALFVLPPGSAVPAFAEPIVYRRVATRDHTYLLTLGPERAIRELEQELGARRGRPLYLPRWLHGDPAEALEFAARRRAELDDALGREQTALDRISATHGVAEAVGDIHRLEWMLDHLSGLPVSEDLAWVTGWTSEADGRELRSVLAAAGIPGVLHFPPPPEAKTPPTLIRNPAWARPFELFARLLGTPARDEADPSQFVAVLAPLLFGYMFGDVGQGAVLLAAGLMLRRRMPALALLIPGGALAMVFGLAFGTVFAREDLIPALWLRPIAEPLPLLVVPLAGGALVILLGLALSAVSAHWHGRLRHWLATEGGLVLIYCGAGLAVLHPATLFAVIAGLVWYVAGYAWLNRREGPPAAAAGLGELAERLLQLAVNTLSFVRVGAFALAHAGLSLAVVSLAEAGGHMAIEALVLLVGNAVIIALEGLVVSVQTTRLILFEFFIRFLRGEGRPFRPSLPPTTTAPSAGGPR